ncbi:hypothetical protein DCE93_02570 [Agromyces badenianii]|uniref:Uncharacterized protein n=1 Tax=Agromyces badenianii TaxID=2080742 RepID=A0A2S0WTK4_9MICO|nr:hypothetical protein [Agromyces badenianii]AWB94676.1 hypothetical protein DCE93_02570 [Agromyces badenianii]
MSDLLHWYARAHGPRAYRIVRSVRSAERERQRADASARVGAAGREPAIVDGEDLTPALDRARRRRTP